MSEKIILCPYWLVRNDDERKSIEVLTGKHWSDIGIAYPYYMGYEPDFNFQLREFHNQDYTLPDGRIYKYELQALNQSK